MRRFAYKEVAQELKALDPALGALLGAIWESASPGMRERLCFYRASYSFRSYVLKEGRALTPKGDSIPNFLKVAGDLPFGLVLRRTVEVVDDLIRGNDLIEMPQALLGQSNLIGSFEFIDHRLAVAGPIPDWSISAGARSLRFVEFPTQEVQWRRLRSRYPRLPLYHEEETPNLRESELLDLLQEHGGCSDAWRADIIFFDPTWFLELDTQLSDVTRYVPAFQMLNYFKDSAWASLARVRDRAVKLEDAINEWGGDNSAQHCKAAYLLLRYAMDINLQRRPCFIPLNGNEDLGPIDKVQENLLGVAKLNPTILGPSYLREEQAGFVSLSQLLPSAFMKRPEEALEQIFSIIGKAKKSAAESAIFIPGLSNVGDLFKKLMFRVRTGRDRGSGKNGTVSTFRITYDNNGKYKRLPVPLSDFYAPYFSGGATPLSDSRFFRVSMKIDLRSLLDARGQSS